MRLAKTRIRKSVRATKPVAVETPLTSYDPNAAAIDVGATSHWVAVPPTSINSHELPKCEVIEAAAQRVYGLLTSPKRSVRGETEAQRVLQQVQANEQIFGGGDGVKPDVARAGR